MTLPQKLIAGLERLAETLRSLQWLRAKAHGISPIQLQILLFTARHRTELANVSYLAQEFNVTKATVSDAVRVLLAKGYLTKDHSPTDARRYNLLLTPAGEQLVDQLDDYTAPLQSSLTNTEEATLRTTYDTLAGLIYQLHQNGLIPVQRMCYACRHYEGDRRGRHRCRLLEIDLAGEEVRLDCPEFEARGDLP